MKLLVWLNRLAVFALAVGFATLLHDKIDASKDLSELKYAIAQSKKGERFTANDGRLLCMAIVSAHPETEQILPEVCKK